MALKFLLPIGLFAILLVVAGSYAFFGSSSRAPASRNAMPARDTSVVTVEGAVLAEPDRSDYDDAARGQVISSSVSAGTEERQESAGRLAANDLKALSGQVLSATGMAIADAVVSLTPPTLCSTRMTLDRDLAAIIDGSILVRSEADGKFSLPVLEGLVGGSVVWVSHSEYESVWRIIQDSTFDLPPFILAASKGLRVVVVDGSGTVLPGASVFTCLADYDSDGIVQSLPGDVRMAFVRRERASDDGLALLPPTGRNQYVMAFLGEMRSAPWFGKAPAELRLELVDSVQVSGEIVHVGDGGGWNEMDVTAFSYTPAVRRVIGRASVTSAGSFGPIILARDEEAKLLLRLEGPGILPFERAVEFPLPGGHVSLRLEALPGLEIPIVVLGDMGEGIPMADIRFWWPSDEAWVYAHSRSDSTGNAKVWIRPGAVWIQASALGYQDVALPEQSFVVAAESPFTLRMNRAGSIGGRVVADGNPVSAFQVRYWHPNGATQSHHVVDAADGAFVIDAAPFGDVQLSASKPGGSPGRTERITVVPGLVADVTLHLPEEVSAKGSLVDAFSGQPIADGRIQSWFVASHQWLEPTGVAAYTGANGEFYLEGLALGVNHLLASATGYSQLAREVALTDGHLANVGSFALVPLGSLGIALVSRTAVDPTSYTVRLEGVLREGVPFSKEGRVVVNNVPSGAATIIVTYPDGTELRQVEYVNSGGYREVAVDVEVAGESVLEVFAEGWETAGDGLGVLVSTSMGLDQRREFKMPLLQGRAFIPGPFGQAIWVELLQGNGTLLVRQLLMTEVRSGRILLPVQRERHRFQVVDESDAPLPGATVIIAALPETGWLSWGETDGIGVIELPVPPERSLLLSVRDPRGGGMLDVALEPHRMLSGETRIVLEPDAELELCYRDGENPVGGVQGNLLGSSMLTALKLSSADSAGVASTGGISAGRYLLRVRGPEVWPLAMDFRVQSGRNQRIIQVRRVGTLSLEVSRLGGVVVSNALVVIRSVEFSETIDEWVRIGRLPVTLAAATRTDDRGVFSVAGVPNGAYRYTVVGPDGEVAEGEVVVPPHGTARVEVELKPQ